jgi:hypothetical protein
MCGVVVGLARYHTSVKCLCDTSETVHNTSETLGSTL